MKIKCSIEKLKNAVSLAEKMSGKNLTLPVLQSILLTSGNKSLKIRSTNLNVGIEIEIPAIVEKEGMVAVNGNILANVCNNLAANQEVELRLENDNLTLQSKKNTTIIKSITPDDFPTLPVVEGESFEIKSDVLKEGIKSVAFASATSEIKPEISSIYLYSENGFLYLVSTDSFRLAERKIILKNIPEISKILIPYKNIPDLIRVLDVSDGEIKINYSRNQISLNTKNIYFTSRLIDGGFPPYQLIIPKEENTKIIVLKQDLVDILKLSTIFADKFYQVVLNIDPINKKMSISSKNNEVGSSVSLIDCVIEGESIEVSCNLKYFLDVFPALNGDSLSISFSQPNKPIIIKSVSDKNFLYLLMPANR